MNINMARRMVELGKNKQQKKMKTFKVEKTVTDSANSSSIEDILHKRKSEIRIITCFLPENEKAKPFRENLQCELKKSVLG